MRDKESGESVETMEGYAAVNTPTLWIEKVSIRQVRLLLFMLSASATAPTALVVTVFLYLQSALGMTIKPETVIAGVLITVTLSLFILWREARKVFMLIDAVPELQLQVKKTGESVDEIRVDIRKVKDIGEAILRKDTADEWRLSELERFKGRIEQEERERRRRKEDG
jgi:ABC-type nickel/cobalt efflux system permease component RcnA